MKGWGGVSSLLALGLFVGVGCGGRTSALSEGYGPDGYGADGSGADGSGADGFGASAMTGGAGPVAGRPSRAGAASYGGTIGVGGVGVIGGYPSAGGYAFGGVNNGYGGGYVGGGYPVGGYYAFGGAYAGTGYGGNPRQPAGECCEAQMGASCQPRAVAKCVCQSTPYCCEKQWDIRCASLVEPLGCGSCERYDCQSCVNASCSFELSQCFQDFGCLSIFGCMQDSGCQAFQCYNEGQCKGVIDTWGGPGGSSMGLLLQAFSCAFQSGCGCN